MPRKDKKDSNSPDDRVGFLESLDGVHRDIDTLVKVATPTSRIQFSMWMLTKNDGGHRYRALFDEAYRERTRPGYERLEELRNEFEKLRDYHHRTALEYYFGKMTDEQAKEAIQKDREEVGKEIELAGGGMPGQQEDEFDLGLEDWRKEADYDI